MSVAGIFLRSLRGLAPCPKIHSDLFRQKQNAALQRKIHHQVRTKQDFSCVPRHISVTRRAVMEKSTAPSKQRKHYVAHLAFGALSSFVLAGALFLTFPYAFYALLKVIVFSTCGVFATTTNSVARLWTFVAVALIYNPLLPLKGFQKGMWEFINFATILIIVISLIVEYRENAKEALAEDDDKNESGE